MNNLIEQGFEHLEREAIGNIRRKIMSTNNISDLRYVFSFNVSQNINIVLEPEINISAQDISFSPEMNKHYILSDRLMNLDEFTSKWSGTRLPHFVQKVADTTYLRYVHLTHHTEKKRHKIRKIILFKLKFLFPKG